MDELELIQKIYKNINENYQNGNFMSKLAKLASKNNHVD